VSLLRKGAITQRRVGIRWWKSTVCTVINAYETQGTFQRKCFYAKGRFWVFYANFASGNFEYRTSIDGKIWSEATIVRAGEYGPHMSIFFDGTFIHYAYTGYATAIYYRRGIPNSDGTIAWSADEQTVNTNSNQASNPAVAVDSNGYAWIGYREGTAGTRTPWIIKSGNNNGTWGTTPNGFPYQLSATQSSYWTCVPVPLTNGKMLVVYAHHFTDDYGYPIEMRAWDGSDWLDVVATISGIYHSMHYSEVAEGDDVHIVFWKYVSNVLPTEVVYVKYSYASNSLSAETCLQDNIPNTTDNSKFATPIISKFADSLIVFWSNYPEQGHIYYTKFVKSMWGSRVNWIDESTELFPVDSWTCFYEAYGGYIGVLYLTKMESPYNIKFAVWRV
jgi:hypothetical protein